MARFVLRRWIGVAAGALLLAVAAALRRGAPPPPETGRTPPFRLVEDSRGAGLIFTHRKLRVHPLLKNLEPELSSLGAYVAVVDYDGDGWMDVFVTSSEQGSGPRLFRNNGDGTFTDVTARAGLADAGPANGALFFDYDNDGHPDLLLHGYFCSKLYHNNGDGTFTDVTRRSGLRHCGNTYAANAIDYSGHGFLDLVIADFYKPVDFTRPDTTRVMENGPVNANNGGPIEVWRNNGDGTFSKVPGALGIRSRGYTEAIGAYDLRGTGRPDLYFATDYGSDQLYFNEGAGRFREESQLVADKFAKDGMSAEIADIDNDGRPAVFVSNIYEPLYQEGQNLLWKWTGRRFRDVARERGVERCLWAWGAKFLDLDNDGWLDLVVANGFISSDPGKSYWFSWGSMGSAAARVMEDARNWPPMGSASFAGYERDYVFWNHGGHFENVTALTAVDTERLDGRGVASMDALNDGRLGFLIANQGQPLRYYRNETRNDNHWIGLALEGGRSNRGAWGAEAVVKLRDGRRLSRQLQPANGFMSQSDPRLHFGLGRSASIERIEILWPSGRRQILRGLALDRYHAVREPR